MWQCVLFSWPRWCCELPIFLLHFKSTPTLDGSVHFLPDKPFTVSCLLSNTNTFNTHYFIEGIKKIGTKKRNLCMPTVEFEAFSLVLLALCSTNSGTRSQPSINRGHKNKRTKHNLHSGGILDSAARSMRVYVRAPTPVLPPAVLWSTGLAGSLRLEWASLLGPPTPWGLLDPPWGL